MAIVVDESWTKLPVGELQANGVVAVSMYVGQDTSGKNMNPAIVNLYAANGIKTITNFEYGAAQATAGFGQGASDARLGLSIAVGCGMPAWAPIIFSVDEQTSAASVLPYFQGACSVLGVARVGVYGSYDVVRGVISAGAARWGWQTVAWSAGQVDIGQIQMYQPGSELPGGADVDLIEGDISAIAWLPGQVNPAQPVQWTEVAFSMKVPTISQASPGPSALYVGLMQAALNARTLGGGAAVLTVDNSFGPGTTARLEQYQTANHLTVDGVCGPLTWASLLNRP